MTKKKKRIMIISIVITLVILSVAALYANLKVFTRKAGCSNAGAYS